MNQTKQRTPEVRDKDLKLFEEVLSILSEDFMQEFIEHLTYDGYHTLDHAKILDRFVKKTEYASWHFFNEQVQDHFENLKESWHDLNAFHITHFFLTKNGFRLYPQKIGTIFWKKQLKELKPLVKNFSHAYSVFIEQGHKILYRNEQGSPTKRTPPKSYNRGRMYYILIGKERIRIAKISTRQSLLLEALITPFGAQRTIDSAYGALWLPKDDKNQRLDRDHYRRAEQEKIIRNTIKELQSIFKTHKIELFQFYIKDGLVWMNWRGKIE